MIRNETFVDGICVYAEIVDGDIVYIEDNGQIVGSRPAVASDLPIKHNPKVDQLAEILAELPDDTIDSLLQVLKPQA